MVRCFKLKVDKQFANRWFSSTIISILLSPLEKDYFANNSCSEKNYESEFFMLPFILLCYIESISLLHITTKRIKKYFFLSFWILNNSDKFFFKQLYTKSFKS